MRDALNERTETRTDMRALLCKEFGPPESLVVEDIPVPEPGPDEIRISVAAAGVNFPDFLLIENKYQFKPELPFSPGGEMAGTVTAVGAEVTDFRIGEKVMGSAINGAFAEEALIKAAHAARYELEVVGAAEAAGKLRESFVLLRRRQEPWSLDS